MDIQIKKHMGKRLLNFYSTFHKHNAGKCGVSSLLFFPVILILSARHHLVVQTLSLDFVPHLTETTCGLCWTTIQEQKCVDCIIFGLDGKLSAAGSTNSTWLVFMLIFYSFIPNRKFDTFKHTCPHWLLSCCAVWSAELCVEQHSEICCLSV